MDADDALRAIMDAISIDTVGEVSAVRFTPVGLADLAEALAGMITAARSEGEATGYRRAVDDACAALDKRYSALESRLVDDDHYGAGRLRGLDLAEEIVRKLAPVEPVSKADELPAGGAS
jgi:hypothetical protein